MPGAFYSGAFYSGGFYTDDRSAPILKDDAAGHRKRRKWRAGDDFIAPPIAVEKPASVERAEPVFEPEPIVEPKIVEVAAPAVVAPYVSPPMPDYSPVIAGIEARLTEVIAVAAEAERMAPILAAMKLERQILAQDAEDEEALMMLL